MLIFLGLPPSSKFCLLLSSVLRYDNLKQDKGRIVCPDLLRENAAACWRQKMVRMKRALSVLLCSMFTIAVAFVISDFVLLLTFVSPRLRFWPLDWYLELLLPPGRSHEVLREVKLDQDRMEYHPESATSTQESSNMTFVFHIFPGAGSGVLLELIETLQDRRPEQIAHVQEMPRLSFPPIKQWSHWHRVRNSLIQVIHSTPKPCVVFVESPVFLTINVPNVYYFSVMYDPLQRLQNHYKLDHWGDDLTNYMHPNWPRKLTPSFTRCVQSGGKDCSYPLAKHFYTLWFCGFDKNPRCVHKKEISRASILARRTIESFQLVGVMEQLGEFVMSLEAQTPSVFGGLGELYWSDAFRQVHEDFKPKRNNSLEAAMETRLKETLKDEYSLYQFAKSNFHKQFMNLTSGKGQPRSPS